MFLTFSLILVLIFSQTIVFAQEPNFDGNDEIKNFESIVVIIAGFATAAAVIFLGYQTMKLRGERNMTLRAWVGESEGEMGIQSFINAKNEEKSHVEMSSLSDSARKEFNWIKLRRSIKLKNFGQVPAVDAKCRGKIVIGSQPTRDNIKKTTFGSSTTILPNGTHLIFFEFTREIEDDKVDPKKDVYFILETEYKSANSKKIRLNGSIMKLYRSHYLIRDSWDENV